MILECYAKCGERVVAFATTDEVLKEDKTISEKDKKRINSLSLGELFISKSKSGRKFSIRRIE